MNEKLAQENIIKKKEEDNNRKLQQDNAYSGAKLKYIDENYEYEDPVIAMKTDVYGSIVQANQKANTTFGDYEAKIREFVDKVRTIKQEKDMDKGLI